MLKIRTTILGNTLLEPLRREYGPIDVVETWIGYDATFTVAYQLRVRIESDNQYKRFNDLGRQLFFFVDELLRIKTTAGLAETYVEKLKKANNLFEYKGLARIRQRRLVKIIGGKPC